MNYTSADAKNAARKNPSQLPGVEPGYDIHIDNASQEQEGTAGFEDKLSGTGIAGRHGTSSFNADTTAQRKVHIRLTPGDGTEAEYGQEEGCRLRCATSGIVGRNDNRFTESQTPPSRNELYTPFLILQ